MRAVTESDLWWRCKKVLLYIILWTCCWIWFLSWTCFNGYSKKPVSIRFLEGFSLIFFFLSFVWIYKCNNLLGADLSLIKKHAFRYSVPTIHKIVFDLRSGLTFPQDNSLLLIPGCFALYSVTIIISYTVSLNSELLFLFIVLYNTFLPIYNSKQKNFKSMFEYKLEIFKRNNTYYCLRFFPFSIFKNKMFIIKI